MSFSTARAISPSGEVAFCLVRALSDELFKEYGISSNKYEDSPGLCKAATLSDIEALGWTLNPGRYVGVKQGEVDDIDFVVEFEKLSEDLAILNAEAHELEGVIDDNASKILGK